MNAREPIVGVLLAGGRSSRMGGGDKCLLPLAGRPILAHVIERLKSQLSDLIVSANGDPARFASFRLPVVEDRLGDFAGPLAGIHAGLEWTRANRPRSRFVITAASDTPFLPADLVSRFRAAIGQSQPKLLVARSQAGLHPTFGLWPVSLADALADSLKTGARKVTDWVRQHQAEEVTFPEVEVGGRKIDPFFNINRQDDLMAAEAFLEAIAV
jgi:molybdenum cofactor guanylyltransferase